MTIAAFPGVFGGPRLDGGAELLMHHLPDLSDNDRVVDLGAGTGVIGIACAIARPTAQLIFVDDSYLAVESARLNWVANLGDRPATFVLADRLTQFAPGIDHIVCNPPFHQQHVIGDDTAWQLFHQSRRVLRRDGTLTVVGNRHLGYHAKLRRLFGNAEVVASIPEFVVVRVDPLQPAASRYIGRRGHLRRLAPMVAAFIDDVTAALGAATVEVPHARPDRFRADVTSEAFNLCVAFIDVDGRHTDNEMWALSSTFGPLMGDTRLAGATPAILRNSTLTAGKAPWLTRVSTLFDILVTADGRLGTEWR